MPVVVPEGDYNRELICGYLRVSKNSSYLTRSKADGKSPFLMPGSFYENYVPILEMFREENINEKNVKFGYVDGSGYNINNSINTYDEFRGNHRFRSEVLETKYINVSKNEILYSPVDMVLNLTNHPVTIKRKGGIEQVFIPIINSSLSKVYGGKLHIIELYYFTNPEVISALNPHLPNSQNYLEVKANQYKSTDKYLYKIYNDAFEFWNYMHNNLKNIDTSSFVNLDKLVSEAPIVLVYTTIITESWFERAKQEADPNSISGIYIPHKDIIVTTADIYVQKDNLFPKDPTLEALTKHLEHNVYLYEIVDNESKVSDRYVSIYNEPVLVPKVKDTSREDGFYVYKLNKNYEKVLINRYDLDKIDKLSFVFKSAEEAKERLDSEKIFKKKMAEIENEHNEKMKAMEENMKAMDKKIKDNDYEISKLRKEREERENENKKIKEERDREHEEKMKMLDFVFQSNKYRREMESYNRKEYYEERKFQRDETLETLKTVAAIAGVVSTGMLLYYKLVK